MYTIYFQMMNQTREERTIVVASSRSEAIEMFEKTMADEQYIIIEVV